VVPHVNGYLADGIFVRLGEDLNIMKKCGFQFELKEMGRCKLNFYKTKYGKARGGKKLCGEVGPGQESKQALSLLSIRRIRGRGERLKDGAMAQE